MILTGSLKSFRRSGWVLDNLNLGLGAIASELPVYAEDIELIEEKPNSIVDRLRELDRLSTGERS